jgi:hypothetical protein
MARHTAEHPAKPLQGRTAHYNLHENLFSLVAVLSSSHKMNFHSLAVAMTKLQILYQ